MIKKIAHNMLESGGKKSRTKTMASDKLQEASPLYGNVQKNLEVLHQVFDNCADVVFREFMIGAKQPIKAFVVYLDSLTDNKMMSENLLRPLQQGTLTLPHGVSINKGNAQQVLLNHVLHTAETSTTDDLIKLADFVLEGNTALVFDKSTTAIVTALRGESVRNVEKSEMEPVVRGPQEGFVESLNINLGLIRRQLRSSRLKIEILQVGTLSKTKVAVCYIEGLDNDKIVTEVKVRIGRINTASVVGSNYIEEIISDECINFFPLIQYTERPDKTVASLVEGKVAVIVDNTPNVLLAPTTLVSILQSAEDYYINAFSATITRLLRYIGLIIALLMPAVTVALFSFHQVALPTSLLSTAAAARENLPFPVFVEILGLEFIYDLLQEAGVRLPKSVGHTVSMVGGIVIGQAAVTAGLVSPISVIVISVTAISNFGIPNWALSISIRHLRIAIIILAGFMGGMGIMAGLMVILAYLCGLRSFGVPYLSPFAPLRPRYLKDTIVRVPWWAMFTQPLYKSTKYSESQEQTKAHSRRQKRGERK